LASRSRAIVSGGSEDFPGWTASCRLAGASGTSGDSAGAAAPAAGVAILGAAEPGAGVPTFDAAAPARSDAAAETTPAADTV